MPRPREFERLQAITIGFTEEQYERLTQAATAQKRSMSFLVREAVDVCYPPTDPEDDASTEPTPAPLVLVG